MATVDVVFVGRLVDLWSELASGRRAPIVGAV